MGAGSYSDCIEHDHFVQFFPDDELLTAGVSRYVHQTLAQGATCVVVATAEHRRAIHFNLLVAGLNVDSLIGRYQYISLDAFRTLSRFMLNGHLDRERFHQVIGLLVHQAASRGHPVRIFGEMVALLAARGQMSAALQLEEQWNELSRAHAFTLFCAYLESDIRYDLITRRRISLIHNYERFPDN